MLKELNEIDNNRTEHSIIKPFVIGRKTGYSMAMKSVLTQEAFSFSLIETCKQH
ncbi:TPA: hypothetical protein KKW55_001422 [Legionella pneumophila]|uniref:hypothetical protein n=1 Tax=Legionella sp. PC997 TaxID=2755562 RepID=UPI000A9F8B61|nr:MULTISPECIES: hypothetical protein [Legionella]QMT59246.1 hypothetical protein HBNCFIEN_00607 [Legionella sp. PC997]HAT1864856.1 hypothetical protein [Legionella pneumophila]HAT1875088.1 hypothetical protein [Legionella pneumophila]HAT1972245.1 hypothetical protein [Legionella pneumophila]HAT2144993.1 hypothetical protein [Legionella pneumophila]